jgi:hypothetical protein
MNAGPTQHALQANRMVHPQAFQVEHLATAVSTVRSGLGSVKPVFNLGGLVFRPIEGPLA